MRNINTDALSDHNSDADIEDSEGEGFVDLQRMFRMKRVFNKLKRNKIGNDKRVIIACNHRLLRIFKSLIPLNDGMYKFKKAFRDRQNQDEIEFNMDGVEETPTN
jgi:Mg2+ and Co2+ transporter CorA